MANTFIEYSGDGSTTDYNIPFKYIKQAEVKVTIDGVATTAFTFPTAGQIRLTDPTNPDTNNATIRVYRETDVSNLKAEFFAGSAIKAEDLNDNFKQNNYAVEELRESTWDFDTETIKTNETWSSVDTQIATTAAVDNRIDAKIDAAITGDIATDGTGITVTDDGDGTITLGLSSGGIDFDRINPNDILTSSEQLTATPSDNEVYTALSTENRFGNFVNTSEPSTAGRNEGQFWYQPDADKTLHVYKNGTWEAITSGGTFTRLDKVIYVDATNGSDLSDGHRISSPKQTIKAAVEQINQDATHGDGSVILVSPGIYQEVAPIQIQRRDVSIIGASIRNTVVHPTAATQYNTLFEVNSGTYLTSMTFTGMKAQGTRGESGSVYEDATYGLPATQGWNVGFFQDAMIYKSPYIQNCTNFSDSEVSNSNLNFYEGTEDKGRAGDLDSDMTGGGLLIDGNVPHDDSPLRSIVCDSYTHTGLDAPGIFVTNNGYCQATSSYAFFNHFHIACLNGGQANLAASTTDFGRFSIIADGKSPVPIFSANTTAVINPGDTTFTIDLPTTGTGEKWHGSDRRPQDNMVVEVTNNNVTTTYPILSATANGANGWSITISRVDTQNRTVNLGFVGDSTDPADTVPSSTSVSFYLRSMVASSGHTMEYVGSGTNYSALPENGGVPDDTKQITELNGGKVWAAVTDHRGKFKVGSSFAVDQQTGFVDVVAGSISIQTLLDDLDLNGNKIISSTASNDDIVFDPGGTGSIDVSTSRIVNVTDPTGAQDAATKNYVDGFIQTNGNVSTTDNTSFFTTTASDARYFRQDNTETITSGVAWSSDDQHVATTSAINARIVDLLDNIGGFVPIADETSFPTTNPDTNDAEGTIVSIVALSANYTPPSTGVVTFTNGTTNDPFTVTVQNIPAGLQITNGLPQGFGVLVETTTTLHTYNFHRIVPKATEVTTVASISSDVTTVAGVAADVTTVAGIHTDVTAVAGDQADIGTVATGLSGTNPVGTVATDISKVTTVANNLNATPSSIDTVHTNIANVNKVGAIDSAVSAVAAIDSAVSTCAGTTFSGEISTVAGIQSDVTAVAGKATQIGLLGTTDAISDMNTLGTTDVVSDMNTLATTVNVNNMATCASTTNITNIATVANIDTEISTVAGMQTAVTNVNNNETNINTVATNISDVTAVATDINDIKAVNADASDIGLVAGSISNVNAAATNITSINNFANKYRVSATAPGSGIPHGLVDGDLWYDTTNHKLHVFNSNYSYPYFWRSLTNPPSIPPISYTNSPDYYIDGGDKGQFVNISGSGNIQMTTTNLSTYSAGDLTSIFNDTGSDKTITPGSGVTLYLAGTSLTGARTIAQRGFATILCVGTNEFVISGGGVT